MILSKGAPQNEAASENESHAQAFFDFLFRLCAGVYLRVYSGVFLYARNDLRKRARAGPAAAGRGHERAGFVRLRAAQSLYGHPEGFPVPHAENRAGKPGRAFGHCRAGGRLPLSHSFRSADYRRGGGLLRNVGHHQAAFLLFKRVLFLLSRVHPVPGPEL